MVIRDKQELKRCVKQAVRRAQVVESAFSFDLQNGACGVSALLETWAAPAGAPNDALRRACAQSTPFGEGAATMFAALSALELPGHNLNNAQTIAQSYDRSAYIREVLDAMHARRVLVCVPAGRAGEAIFDDERFLPVLSLEGSGFFAPGRFGVNYQERASALQQMMALCGAKVVYAPDAGYDALAYCLLPLSEDTGCVLQLDVQQEALIHLIKAHPAAKAMVSCPQPMQRMLIDQAADAQNILVLLSDLSDLPYALARLNTRLMAYTARAALPEQMLGRWKNAREAIWPMLFDAYLPLARSGFELTSDAVIRDVDALLGGSLDSFLDDTL